eukprot:9429118-Pyramimonas_sp.AAC.1
MSRFVVRRQCGVDGNIAAARVQSKRNDRRQSPFEPSSGCKRNKGMYKESAVAGLRGRRREGKSSPKEGQDFQFDSLTESEGNTSAAGVASRSPLKHHLDGVVLRATQSTVRGFEVDGLTPPIMSPGLYNKQDVQAVFDSTVRLLLKLTID